MAMWIIYLLQKIIWNPTTDSGTHLVFGDQFNPNDAYEGEQRIGATYFSAEFYLIGEIE